MINKGRHVLEHILDYCNDIQKTIQRYGDNVHIFEEDTDYKNSICMSIQQIGELEGLLSEEFRAQTKQEIPWPAIRQTRNIIAHYYGNVKIGTIWSTAHEDIDALRAFCKKQLEDGMNLF